MALKLSIRLYLEAPQGGPPRAGRRVVACALTLEQYGPDVVAQLSTRKPRTLYHTVFFVPLRQQHAPTVVIGTVLREGIEDVLHAWLANAYGRYTNDTGALFAANLTRLSTGSMNYIAQYTYEYEAGEIRIDEMASKIKNRLRLAYPQLADVEILLDSDLAYELFRASAIIQIDMEA